MLSLFFSFERSHRSVDPKELAALGANALLHLAGMAVPWRWSVRLRTNLAEGDDEELADDSQDISRNGGKMFQLVQRDVGGLLAL